MPLHFFATGSDVLAESRRGWNENVGLQIQRLQKCAILLLDFEEAPFGIVRQVHFVDDNAELPHSEQAQQIGVPFRLLLHALISSDYEHSRIRARSTGDHI